MQETLTNSWFHQLKAGNRLLIKKNGGIEPSAEITSLSKSQIGRCHSDSDTELLPLPALLRLEAECGDPVVTRIMAGLHGCKLSDPEATQKNGACVIRESLDLGARNAEYQKNALLAASDMKVTPAEARAAIRDLQSIAEKTGHLIRIYSDMVAHGGSDVAALRVVGEEE